MTPILGEVVTSPKFKMSALFQNVTKASKSDQKRQLISNSEEKVPYLCATFLRNRSHSNEGLANKGFDM